MFHIDLAKTDTTAGQEFYFQDICIVLRHNDIEGYLINVWRPIFIKQVDPRGELIFAPNRIATMSFTDKQDAIELTNYILCKIVLADTLLGWINAT